MGPIGVDAPFAGFVWYSVEGLPVAPFADRNLLAKPLGQTPV